MSEERFCELCHKLVWFGAYGTTEDHVDFSTNDAYDSREKVCVDCIKKLNVLVIIKKEEKK